MGLLRESSTRDRQAVLVYATIAVLFVVLYLVLFPRALPGELTLVPNKAVPLTEVTSAKLSATGSFFTLGNWEGYWDSDGTLERAQAKRPQAVASGDSLAWYDGAHNQVVVEGRQGVRFTLPGEEYPAWSQGRLYTFDENRLGLRAFDANGKLLWSKHFSSIITAIDSSTDLTVVGTLDGKLQVFGPKGDVAGGFQPGGSRLPVIYNVAISPKDKAILVLAGVDPKRFLVLERGSSDFRPVFHKPLKENRPWPTPLGFLGNGTLAYYQTDRGLAFLEPGSPDHETVLEAHGSPLALESLPGGRLVAFVEADGQGSTLRVASTLGASLMTLPFSTTDLLLKRQGSSLILGVDQTLLRFEVRIQ